MTQHIPFKNNAHHKLTSVPSTASDRLESLSPVWHRVESGLELPLAVVSATDDSHWRAKTSALIASMVPSDYSRNATLLQQ